MKEDSWIYVNTYNSLNNIDGIGSFWLFSFGAKRMFLSYEMSENFDWARDDEHLLFLRCWQGKEKKMCLHFCCFYVTTFCEQSTFIKKKKLKISEYFYFSFCSQFMLKFSKANA